MFGQHKMFPSLLFSDLGSKVPPKVMTKKAIFSEVAEPYKVVGLGAEPLPPLRNGLLVIILSDVVKDQMPPWMAGQDSGVGFVDDDDSIARRRVVCIIGSYGPCQLEPYSGGYISFEFGGGCE